RRVATGIVRLAMALRAAVIPIAAWSTRGVTVGPQSRVRLPLPHSRVFIATGNPTEVQGGQPLRFAERVQAELIHLRSVARQAAGGPFDRHIGNAPFRS